MLPTWALVTVLILRDAQAELAGFTLAAAAMCFGGFALTRFMTRELEPEQSDTRRACPECAELIQTAARKCRFCGSPVTPFA